MPETQECVHSILRDSCIYCGPLADVPLTVRRCETCRSGTWHRDDTGACVICGSTQSSPFGLEDIHK